MGISTRPLKGSKENLKWTLRIIDKIPVTAQLINIPDRPRRMRTKTKFYRTSFVACLISIAALPGIVPNSGCTGKQHSDIYFSKKQLDCDFRSDADRKYYKIVFTKADSSAAFPCYYHFPEFDRYSEKEKLEMVEELLSYEGDKSICSVKLSAYVPHLHDKGFKTDYSIQVEALYIIDKIILPASAHFPLLGSKRGDEFESVDGPMVKQVYVYYKDWLKKAQQEGIANLVSKNIVPLPDNSPIRWY